MKQNKGIRKISKARLRLWEHFDKTDKTLANLNTKGRESAQMINVRNERDEKECCCAQKFLCLTHGEAKQTEISEPGIEKESQGR